MKLAGGNEPVKLLVYKGAGNAKILGHHVHPHLHANDFQNSSQYFRSINKARTFGIANSLFEEIRLQLETKFPNALCVRNTSTYDQQTMLVR